MSHTPEPWSYQDNDYYSEIIGQNGQIGDLCASNYSGENNGRENARRIVACVNACSHFTTDELESVGEHFSGVLVDTKLRCAELVDERDTYRAMCVELCAALKMVNDEHKPSYHDCTDDGKPECEWCLSKSAITKAEKLLGGE